jgi:hypothetical protein
VKTSLFYLDSHTTDCPDWASGTEGGTLVATPPTDLKSSCKVEEVSFLQIESEFFVRPMNARHKTKSPSTLRRLTGMVMASTFTSVYFVAPTWTIVSIMALVFRWPSLPSAFVIAFPVILSALFPPVASPWILRCLSPILDYFEYEQILEDKPVDVRANMLRGKSYIIAAQPHGVVSFCGICSAIAADNDFQGKLPTGM